MNRKSYLSLLLILFSIINPHFLFTSYDSWFPSPSATIMTLDDIPLYIHQTQPEVKPLPEGYLFPKITQISALPSHAPIVLTSNNDFINNSDWTGSGTHEDPYVFSGYFINANGLSGISITNTDVFFRIENVWVNDSSDFGVGGFYFDNVANSYLYNNTVTGCYRGFYLKYSNNNILTDNTAFNNDEGIYLYASTANTVTNNTAISNSIRGFWLQISHSNVLSQNFASDNGNSGFHLGGSRNNVIANNTVTQNSRGFYLYSDSNKNLVTNNTAIDNEYAFFVFDSDNNILFRNLAKTSTDYGIQLYSASDNNTIERNQFVGNNGSGIQAYDNDSDNLFQFNYWDDWTSPDLDGNLIVDLAYAIDGHANNTDNSPLVTFFDVRFITLVNSNIEGYVRSGTIINISISFPYVLERVRYNWNGDTNLSFLLGNTLNYNFSTDVPSTGSQHFLHVYANDSYGYWHSRQFDFSIDDNEPLFFNQGILNGTSQRPGSLIDLSIFDTKAGIASVWYIWDNNGTLYPLSDPYDIPLISSEGWHSLTVYANDTLGNQADFFLIFNVDDTPPIIGLNEPNNGSSIQSGTIIDLIVTGSDNNLMYHWDSDFNETVLISFDPILPDTEGLHELYLYASDSVGNGIFIKYVFICDDTPPDILLTSPEYNSILPSRSTINLTISDQNTLSRVLFNWDGNDNVTLEAPYDVLLATGNGEHTLWVYAQDEAGNWANSVFLFTTSDPSFDPAVLLLGLLSLISVFLIVFFYFRSPRRWRHKIEHILVLSQSGLPLYSQAFRDHELKADVVLAGGALIGISSLSNEITQASHVQVIKQKNYCIMLEEGKNVILAVMITEEVKAIRSRMLDFITDFELTFKGILDDPLSETEGFEQAKELVEKYFII